MKNGFAFSFFLLSCVIAVNAQLPFKYDSLYKTMYARDLCAFKEKHPDMVLLDVRTPGEFSDTSRFASLNHGHLKGAINLNIDDISKDSTLLNPYKNKTVVVYCSHSQRSRRLSRFMSINGFTSFYNLNGGMSSLNQLTESEFPCKIKKSGSYLHCPIRIFLMRMRWPLSGRKRICSLSIYAGLLNSTLQIPASQRT